MEKIYPVEVVGRRVATGSYLVRDPKLRKDITSTILSVNFL